MKKRHKRQALVMAFDENFLRGAEVMMRSVLRYNPWFKAEWVVIDLGLSASSRAALEAIYPVRFQPLHLKIKATVADLLKRFPHLKAIETHFGSLQTFSLKGYERAVFLDVDMCCIGDIRSLFEGAPDLGAAPAIVTLEKTFHGLRSRADRSVSLSQHRYGKDLRAHFNSGVFTVSKRYLSAKTFDALLSDPVWKDERLWAFNAESDQGVLNVHFDGKVTPLSPAYNYLYSFEDLYRAAFGVGPDDAKILHFAGPFKPWAMSPKELRALPAEDSAYFIKWAWEARSAEKSGRLDEAWDAFNRRQKARFSAEKGRWLAVTKRVLLVLSGMFAAKVRGKLKGAKRGSDDVSK